MLNIVFHAHFQDACSKCPAYKIPYVKHRSVTVVHKLLNVSMYTFWVKEGLAFSLFLVTDSEDRCIVRSIRLVLEVERLYYRPLRLFLPAFASFPRIFIHIKVLLAFFCWISLICLLTRRCFQVQTLNKVCNRLPLFLGRCTSFDCKQRFCRGCIVRSCKVRFRNRKINWNLSLSIPTAHAYLLHA